MSAYFFNLVTNSEYSNLLIVAAFSLFIFGKISLAVKNSYIPTFTDDEAKILPFVYLNCIELYFDQFCYQLFLFSH